MPWFYRKLPVPVAEDFGVCIYKNEPHANKDLAVENIENDLAEDTKVIWKKTLILPNSY